MNRKSYSALAAAGMLVLAAAVIVFRDKFAGIEREIVMSLLARMDGFFDGSLGGSNHASTPSGWKAIVVVVAAAVYGVTVLLWGLGARGNNKTADTNHKPDGG